jgi:hypothetical protein
VFCQKELLARAIGHDKVAGEFCFENGKTKGGIVPRVAPERYVFLHGRKTLATQPLDSVETYIKDTNTRRSITYKMRTKAHGIIH